MRKYLGIVLFSILALAGGDALAQVNGSGIQQLNQWTSSSSPNAIFPQVTGKSVGLWLQGGGTGCLQAADNGVISKSASACGSGSGGAPEFDIDLQGTNIFMSTTTKAWFKNGLVSASTSVKSTLDVIGNITGAGTLTLTGSGTSTLSGGLFADSLRTNLVSCDSLDTNGSGAIVCGADANTGIAFPFSRNTWGNSTSTTIGLLNGFISSGASSTITDAIQFWGKIFASSTIYSSTTGTSTFLGQLNTAGLSTSKGLTISGGMFRLNGDVISDLTGTCLSMTGTALGVTSGCTDAATLAGASGSAYLARLNHTGTQQASTIAPGTFGAGAYIFPAGSSLLSVGSTTVNGNFFLTRNLYATGTLYSSQTTGTSTFGSGIAITKSGADVGPGLLVTLNSSNAQQSGIKVINQANFAHTGDLIKAKFVNATDSGNLLSLLNAGIGDYLNLDGSFRINKALALITSGRIVSSSTLYSSSTGTSTLLGGLFVNALQTNLPSCDSLDTNSSGAIVCGSDATGGAGGGTTVATSTADWVIYKQPSGVKVYNTISGDTQFTGTNLNGAMNYIIKQATTTNPAQTTIFIRPGGYNCNGPIYLDGRNHLASPTFAIAGAASSTVIEVNTPKCFFFKNQAQVDMRNMTFDFGANANTALFATTTTGISPIQSSVRDSYFENIHGISTTTGHTGYLFDFIEDFRVTYNNLRGDQVGNLWRSSNNYSNAQFINGDSHFVGFNFCELNNTGAGSVGVCWDMQGNRGQVNQNIFDDINGISNDTGQASNDYLLRIKNGSRIVAKGLNSEQFATTTEVTGTGASLFSSGIYIESSKYITPANAMIHAGVFSADVNSYNVNFGCKEVEVSASTFILYDRNTNAGQPNTVHGIDGSNCVIQDNGGTFLFSTSTASLVRDIYDNVGGETWLSAVKLLGDKIAFAWSAGVNATIGYFNSALSFNVGGSDRLTITTGTSTFIGGLAVDALKTNLPSCDSLDTNSSGALVCGVDANTGGAFPFAHNLLYNSTSTTIGLLNGFFSSGASSTISDDLHLIGKIFASSTLYSSVAATNTFLGGLSVDALKTNLVSCDSVDTNSSGALVCGTDANTGGAWPFSHALLYNSTSTVIGFLGGFFSSGASSTISDDLHLTGKIFASTTFYSTFTGTSTFGSGTSGNLQIKGTSSTTISTVKILKLGNGMCAGQESSTGTNFTIQGCSNFP